ncbi:MAG: class I SAM-dependent methyltransferase [Vicinamibacterales bacterium]
MKDAYAKIDYRSLVDWPRRLAREWPFFERAFSGVPLRRVLDLGSGGGEHARLFASHGLEAAGVDLSPDLVDEARAAMQAFRGIPEVTFAAGDIARVSELVAGPFGAAVCLGNTLPHILDDETLGGLVRQLRELVLPGGVVIIQMLNYERIFSAPVRYLPPLFRPHPEGETVFLRILDPQGDGRTVIFTPSTLLRRLSGEPPIEVTAAERVVHRGWRAGEIEGALAAFGFDSFARYGGFDGGAFDPRASLDLVLVAR